MKEKLRVRITSISLFVVLMVLSTHNAFAQGATFTYQGRLTQSGNPASATYDMQFKLFDTSDVGTGTQQGATVTNPTVVVTNGTFTVPLDFGAAVFDGSARYLEIGVRPAGGADPYTILSPRQPLTSTPYSVRSLNATTADALSVACVNCVTSSQIQNVLGSQVSGEIPVASVPSGSDRYIQNQSASAQSGDFRIGGTGTVNILNATTHYNIGGNRVLGVTGGNINTVAGPIVNNSNTFAGVDAGAAVIAGATTFAGNLNTFFRVGDSLAELAYRSKALYEMAPTGDSGISGSTKSFEPQFTNKFPDGSLKDIYCAAILAQLVVDSSKIVQRLNVIGPKSQCFFVSIDSFPVIVGRSTTCLGFSKLHISVAEIVMRDWIRRVLPD